MHEAVLLEEVIEALDPHPGEFVIDGTVDGGGHAAAVLERIMPQGMFLGVDWDETMIRKRIDNKQYGDRERYVCGNYADLPAILAQEECPKADGLLLDLGFSSDQLEASGRGFSFSESSRDEPLIMTYDPAAKPVAHVIREESESSLADIIYQYGGERRSRAIAKAIKLAGRQTPITTSGQLADVVRNALPRNYERGRIDPATRTFQALRIYANGELANLERILAVARDIMAAGGRIAIITFHSLEDRIVKRAFQRMATAGEASLLAKKPVAASREEVVRNPRSRSAKLRALRMNP
ncbi:MAG TPA: 16S rRNA (cytosine(1402)-N(4))-methyltransferase RsmH [Candidatus Paceibacterota bacterium]|nr:16S rRNA (cytosine(1402)-N(4))-methyltransferase RsmH [Candidatus Paceibacterota bacterium]